MIWVSWWNHVVVELAWHRHTQIDNSAYTLERALNALSRSRLLVLTSHSYAHSQPFSIPPSFHSISALLLDRRLE